MTSAIPQDAPPRPHRSQRFTTWVQEKCAQDSGFAAALSRADNPATQPRAWPILAMFGVNLESTIQRESHALVGAYIARNKSAAPGSLGLGRALLESYGKDHEHPSARLRLRRLLSATTTEEACRILRPMLSLIASRGVSLDAAALLSDLLGFHSRPERIKARWAQDFYGSGTAPSNKSGKSQSKKNSADENQG